MAEVFFFIAAIGAIGGAYGVIRDWNPFYNVLALVVHLISLAALFLLLRAEFVAAAQVVVYAGAVMVLYVFVVAYVGGSAEPMRRPFAPGLRGLAILFAGVLLVELWIVLLGSGLKGIDSQGAGFNAAVEDPFGSPGALGNALLTKFLLPFELASLLLLVAAVGAVVLARRRRGTDLEGDDGDVVSVIDALRPAGTGTMKEGVSGIPDVGGEPAGSHPKATDPSRPEIAAGVGEGDRDRGGW